MECHGVPWNSKEFHGVSIEVHGMPCSSMEFHVIAWNSMHSPWSSMEFYGVPWNFMEFHGVSMKFDIHSLYSLYENPAVIGHNCCGVPANVLSVCLFWRS